MLYKNSIKLLFSNFNLVWKIALYLVVVALISFGLLVLCLNPIVEMISEAGFFAEIIDLYSDFLSSLNLAEAFESLAVIVNEAILFVIENISSIWINIFSAGLIVFFLNNVLFNLTHLPACMSLHLYIGSLTRQGFFSSFSFSFGKNLKVQLAQYLVSIPINMAYLGLFMLSLRMFGISWAMNLIAVFIIIIGFIVLMAFKHTLFAGWIPCIVVMNYGVFRAFGKGIKLAFRKFGRVFSNAVGVIVTIIVLNMFLGTFTFFAGLIISIPISMLLYNIFGMLLVYEGQGMRYYVDIYNVITPTKKENSDKLKEMKYIV